MHWQGADQGDVAQQGWWMSFKEPIQLGYLATTDKVDISAVLPQVAEAISDYLLYKSEPIDVGFFAALGSLAGIPVEKKLNINVGQYTTQNPATITLTDKVLQNQNVTPNCYGGMKFC